MSCNLREISKDAPVISKDQINIYKKSKLANLLAAENLIVQLARVATASFDTKRRVLTLPILKEMTDVDLYDYFIGHEVSHARNTPGPEVWDEIIKSFGKETIGMEYLNPIEDIRVDRLIKKEYPGLKSIYVRASKTIFDDDFMGIRGMDLMEFPLKDRINIHSKLGIYGHCDVPFEDDELPLLNKAMNVKTARDVVEVAIELMEREQEQEQEQEPEADPDGQESHEGDENEDSDENQEGGGSGEGSEGDSEGDEGETDPDGQDKPENGSDDEQEAQGQDSEQKAPSTQENLEKAMADLVEGGDETSDETGDEAAEHEVESKALNIESLKVLDYNTFKRAFDKTQANPTSQEGYQQAFDMIRKWQKADKAIVNHMINQFNMMKSASRRARTRQKDTGMIDPKKLAMHKIDDKVFLSKAIEHDAKNHAMVFLYDNSSSMSVNMTQQTLRSLFIMTDFCRALGIPFEVYTWYSVYSPYTSWGGNVSLAAANVMSSRDNKKVKYAVMKARVIRTTHAHITFTCDKTDYTTAKTGFTPLNRVALSLIPHIREFKARTRSDRVVAFLMSDGFDNQAVDFASYGRHRIRDGSFKGTTTKVVTYGGKVAEVPDNAFERNKLAIDILRESIGGRVVGIFTLMRRPITGPKGVKEIMSVALTISGLDISQIKALEGSQLAKVCNTIHETLTKKPSTFVSGTFYDSFILNRPYDGDDDPVHAKKASIAALKKFIEYIA